MDLLRESLTITEAQPAEPIVVKLQKDCATLEVTPHSDKPDLAASLLVFSSAISGEPQILSGESNRVSTIANLGPGTYRIYAVSDLDGLEYVSPQAMGDLPFATVNVEAGQNTAVSVDLAERNRR